MLDSIQFYTALRSIMFIVFNTIKFIDERLVVINPLLCDWYICCHLHLNENSEAELQCYVQINVNSTALVDSPTASSIFTAPVVLGSKLGSCIPFFHIPGML